MVIKTNIMIAGSHPEGSSYSRSQEKEDNWPTVGSGSYPEVNLRSQSKKESSEKLLTPPPQQQQQQLAQF